MLTPAPAPPFASGIRSFIVSWVYLSVLRFIGNVTFIQDQTLKLTKSTFK